MELQLAANLERLCVTVTGADERQRWNLHAERRRVPALNRMFFASVRGPVQRRRQSERRREIASALVVAPAPAQFRSAVAQRARHGRAQVETQRKRVAAHRLDAVDDDQSSACEIESNGAAM